MPLVCRTRVNELIERYAAYGIAFLIAPAGYGKTEALHSTFGNGACFVGLAPQATVDQIAQALVAAVVPNSSDALADVLRMPESSRRHTAIVEWIAKRIREHAPIIVLEDFQNVNRDAAARSLIERIINETLSTTRWVIASRETPTLPIAIWIANNQARLPILDTELAFTVDEAAELAEQMTLTLGRETIESVVRQTEGWPIIVQLVLATWTSTSDLHDLDFRTRDVSFDFIASRIWNETSEDEQRILLATAVVPSARPEVLELAGFANAARQLDQVSKRLPLLRQTSATEYRLHDLFRDFVIERHEHQEGFLVELLTRAYESLGDMQQALEIATRNNRRELIAPQLIASGITLIEMGQRTLVTQALNALSLQERQKPVFKALRSYISACEGDISGPLTQLRTIAFDELPPHIRGPVITRASSLAANNGDYETAAVFNDLLLASDDVNLRAQGLGRIGALLARSGDIAQAIAMREELLRLIDYVAIEQRAEVYTNLAFICIANDDVGDAYQYAVIANDLADFSTDSLTKQIALTTLFRVVNIRGEIEEALEYVSTLLALIRERNDLTHYTYALSLGLLVAGNSGNQTVFEQFWSELQRSRLPLADTSVFMVGNARAMNAISRHAISDAIGVCDATLKKVKGTNDKLQLSALLGLLYAIVNEPERAISVLEVTYLHSLAIHRERVQVAQGTACRALAWWMLDKPHKAQQEIEAVAATPSIGTTLLTDAVRAVCGSQRSSMTKEKMSMVTAPLRDAGFLGFADLVSASFVEHTTKLPTPSQLAILRELYIGGTSEDVGRRLGKKTKTIDRAVADVCQLIGCSGRGAAIVYALEHGWLAKQPDTAQITRAQ